MRKKTSCSKTPKNIADAIEKAQVIKDFLPDPEKLVSKENSTKITLFLSTNSVNFFKKKAGTAHVPYQKMIRRVLDLYANQF